MVAGASKMTCAPIAFAVGLRTRHAGRRFVSPTPPVPASTGQSDARSTWRLHAPWPDRDRRRAAGAVAQRDLRGSKTFSTSPARSAAVEDRTGSQAMGRLRPTRLRCRRCSLPVTGSLAKRSPKSSPSAWSGAIPYGTPTNAAAPGRVCGGSSSGSAAAIGGALVDLSLGSDTGVRDGLLLALVAEGIGALRQPAAH